MPATPNLRGQRFGRLVVIERTEERRSNGVLWSCRCDCGTKHHVTTGELRSGNVRSCGCAKVDAARKVGSQRRTHGLSRSRPYRIWNLMKQRCLNQNDAAYSFYGGRGIQVCKRWHEFDNFFDDMSEPPPGLTLERIDNDGPYSPENCIWATRQRQANNRSSTIALTYNGQTQSLADWARQRDLPYQTLWTRLYRYRWSMKKSLTEPLRSHDQHITEAARNAVCSEGTFYRRIRNSWSVRKAMTTPPYKG